MSRCFPFPPPGYELKANREEAMIVSIKGADEKAKKEERRKERKKDKEREESRKDKKERKHKKEKKRKERDGKEGEGEKHSHKRHRKDDTTKLNPSDKLKDSEFNCLVKSGLTEEPELRQSTSQNSCDSTLNSNEILPKQKEKQPLDGRHNLPKQKEMQPLDSRHNISKQKEMQPVDGRRNINYSESIVRIPFPVTRQNDPEVMMSNKAQETTCPSRDIKLNSSQLATKKPVNQHPCSTSAPEHASKPHEEKRKDPSTSASEHASKPHEEKRKDPSTSAPEHASKPHEEKRKDSISRRKHSKEKIHKSKCNCSRSMVLQFLNVVENWVPDTLERRVELINSEDEECWWSKKKPSTTERCRNNEIEPVSNSMGWPRARLLPEADIYALPYTVPF